MSTPAHWSILDALRDPQRTAWDSPGWDEHLIWEVLQKLTCLTPCVGVVNTAGWHHQCQKRAQEAMRALGFTPPDLDPLPEGGDDWL